MCRTKTDEQLGNVQEPPSTAPPPPRGAEGRRWAAHQAPSFLLTLKPEVLGDGLTPGKWGCPGPPRYGSAHSPRVLEGACLAPACCRPARPRPQQP